MLQSGGLPQPGLAEMVQPKITPPTGCCEDGKKQQKAQLAPRLVFPPAHRAIFLRLGVRFPFYSSRRPLFLFTLERVSAHKQAEEAVTQCILRVLR